MTASLRLALCALLPGVLAAPRAEAQRTVSPRLDVSIGPHQIRTTFVGRVSVLRNRVYESNTLAGVSLGLSVSRVATIDMAYRTTMGSAWSLDIVTLGTTLRSQGRTGLHLRLGIGQVTGDQVDGCTIDFVCPGPKAGRKGVFDLSVGVDFRLGGHTAMGPVVWAAQSSGGLPSYRSMGIGLHAALF